MTLLVTVYLAVTIVAMTGLLLLFLKARNHRRLKKPTEIKAFERSWPPLLIVVSEDLKRKEGKLIKAVVSAATYWNERVGLSLFIPPGGTGIGSHFVPIRSAPKDTPKHASLVYTRHVTNERGVLSEVSVYVRPEWKYRTVQELDRALTHALGHCLGLTHDGIHGSVMYGDEPNGVYAVTDRDASFLRSVYS